ncbi:MULTISPECIES: flagellar biosynthesis regulator FlaF [unclassified Bradyrhizobium]|uniref:flagellar biosynthesis regulator FlaF n=1 Tax=unclassified Bradyrhizobium TaxID=2631580 RepID=UPI00247A55A8|nr:MULTISPECIES: flagellar biosynthesis regulator FlaF [unclassified Bradyrhizobium]WGR70093.1 flagellar biosynthesis regulator FlaF [Bradyrhizobium sp. ISRA426]WGR82150.1 flagellar biosynthesis regulator FlaF [Bradyrhizobium sp. ISRA430]WGR85336.1 flagellar biosynthesis regulator FlaF [Bradyrhizobium sp. ISRA432]
MTFEAYEAVVEDSGHEARGRERQALSLGIDRLERIQKGRFSIEELVQSLLYVRRLWTIFIEDLSHPDNGLPDKLRADIISIGIWVVKEADRLREEKSNDVMQLIEINRLIRDALQ